MSTLASPPSVALHLVPSDSTSVSSLLLNVSATYDVLNTTGGNHSGNPPVQVEFYKDAQIGFLVVLFLLIVVGNAIVLAAISLSRERRRSRMNFFIMHLAVCDLLTGPLVVMSDLVEKITTYWYAGEVICRIHKFTQTTPRKTAVSVKAASARKWIRRVSVMYASTYMLVALSVDRLDAVARPMHFGGSWLRAKMLVGTAWILSLVFAIPELVLFRVENQFGGPMCVIDFTRQWQWQAYLTPIAITLFIIPAFIICICYVVIIAIIWRSSHLLEHSQGSRHRGKHREEELLNSRSSPRTASMQSTSRSSSRGVIPQAKIRTIKMTFIIVLVFIVCWSPYFIFNLCTVYGMVPDNTHMRKLATFIQSMAPLNSAANPVIYGIFSTRICKYLRRVYMFRRVSEQICQCCGEESPGPTTTDYTSMTETEDIRLSGDFRRCSENGSRVPYIKQRISEADRALLFMHVRNKTEQV